MYVYLCLLMCVHRQCLNKEKQWCKSNISFFFGMKMAKEWEYLVRYSNIQNCHYTNVMVAEPEW